MESTNLLVLDRTPESAEAINSLLRNSGIKVHVIHVQSHAEVNRALDGYSPFLILYADPDPTEASLEEITTLAADHSVPCALHCDLDDHERLTTLLKKSACLVIDSNNDEQLVFTVNRLLITQQKVRSSSAQKEHLDELEQRYDLLLDSSTDAIAYIHEGLHVYANRAYLESLHLKQAEDLAGMSVLEMMNLPEGNFKSILRDLSRGKFPTGKLTVEVNRQDGSKFNADLDFSQANYEGESCIQMMLQVKDDESRLHAELERVRNTDVLTGLSNRPRLMAQLTEFLEAETNAKLTSAVLYIEPDSMDDPGDRVGLQGIDAHVLELANVVREYLEDGDICGRISDRGIAVLTRRENKEQLKAFAQAIQRAYQNVVIEAEGRSFSASCSVGIVPLGRLSNEAQAVIEQAQQAFAESLEAEDNLVVYRPQLQAVALEDEEAEWVERIRYGLKNDEFRSVHQSIVDLDGEGEHVIENLVLLQNEESEHPFSEFAGIADKHALAGAIDRTMIPAMLKSIADNDEGQIISISAESVADPGFPGWLSDHLKMYAVDAGKLILQIPSDSAQANLKPTQRLMKELAPMGCRLSISEFGSERRTLQLFELLDITYVKLSTELTTELQGNNKSQESIRQIVEAANETDSIVIADEISDTSNLAILWQCGVKMIAGAFLKESSQVVAQ